MAETLKIKGLPIEARPREAFMRSAAPEREISDASLLAILIRTGRKGSSAIDLVHRLINHFGGAAKLVDAKRHLLCEPMVVSRGTADKTFLHPREIFRHAIRLGAVSVIVAHNHPSGDSTPSDEDVAETKRLIEAGELVGIPLDDHVVIGRGGKHVSIMQLMKEDLV